MGDQGEKIQEIEKIPQPKKKVRKKKKKQTLEEIEAEIQRRVEEALQSEQTQKEIQQQVDEQVSSLVVVVPKQQKLSPSSSPDFLFQFDSNKDAPKINIDDPIFKFTDVPLTGVNSDPIFDDSIAIPDSDSQITDSKFNFEDLPISRASSEPIFADSTTNANTNSDSSKPSQEDSKNSNVSQPKMIMEWDSTIMKKEENSTSKFADLPISGASGEPIFNDPDPIKENRPKMEEEEFDKLMLGWVNSKLALKWIRVLDMKTDFSDGVALWALLEICSGLPLSRNKITHPHPTMGKEYCKIKIIENMNCVFKQMEELGIRVGCLPNDIVDGSEAIIRSLLWILFRKYSERGDVPQFDAITRLTKDEAKEIKEKEYDVKKIVVCQSVARTWLFRRHYFNILKAARLRKKVVCEIESSEESYLNQLNVIIELYMKPLETGNFEGGGPTGFTLPKNEIKFLFSNVLEIYSFHKFLLAKIKERVEKWSPHQKVGDIFIDHTPYFKLYEVYCRNYQNALQKLDKLTKISQFRHFLDLASKEPLAIENISLDFLLITPIQRMPRVILLLSSLSLYTLKEEEDGELLERAVCELRGVAEFADGSVRDAERLAQVVSIQAKLKNLPENLTIMIPTRQFICEGVFHLYKFDISSFGNTKFTTPIKIYLFNDSLLLAEKSNLNFLTLIYLDQSPEKEHSSQLKMVKTMPNLNFIQNVFAIVTSEKTWLVRCESCEERDVWMESIDKIYSSWKNEKKETETKKEQNEPETEEYNNISIVGTQKRKEEQFGAKTFTVYLILFKMGKKEFRAARRFSEFDTLFDKIKKVYDKKFSSLSAKQHIFVNMNQETIEYRRIMLEGMLLELLSRPQILQKCTELRTFLCIDDPNPNPWHDSTVVDGSIDSKSIALFMESCSPSNRRAASARLELPTTSPNQAQYKRIRTGSLTPLDVANLQAGQSKFEEEK